MEPEIPAIHQFGGARLVSGKNWRNENVEQGTILTAEQNTHIQRGTAKLYCVGYLSYLDARANMRITGFCRVLEFPQNSLARVPTPAASASLTTPTTEYED